LPTLCIRTSDFRRLVSVTASSCAQAGFATGAVKAGAAGTAKARITAIITGHWSQQPAERFKADTASRRCGFTAT